MRLLLEISDAIKVYFDHYQFILVEKTKDELIERYFYTSFKDIFNELVLIQKYERNNMSRSMKGIEFEPILELLRSRKKASVEMLPKGFKVENDEESIIISVASLKNGKIKYVWDGKYYQPKSIDDAVFNYIIKLNQKNINTLTKLKRYLKKEWCS